MPLIPLLLSTYIQLAFVKSRLFPKEEDLMDMMDMFPLTLQASHWASGPALFHYHAPFSELKEIILYKYEVNR